MGESIQFNHICKFSHLCLDFKTNEKDGNSSCQEWCGKKRTKRCVLRLDLRTWKKKRVQKGSTNITALNFVALISSLHISTPLTSSTTPLHGLIWLCARPRVIYPLQNRQQSLYVGWLAKIMCVYIDSTWHLHTIIVWRLNSFDSFCQHDTIMMCHCKKDESPQTFGISHKGLNPKTHHKTFLVVYMIFFHAFSLDLFVYGFKQSSFFCSGVISISIII
jgi:hypothetical protein